MRLEGKRALITGGARGIGKGVVRRFLDEGAKVVVLDKSEDDLLEMKEEYAADRSSLILISCDLSDDQQLDESAQSAIDYWGGLDILINNAGFAVREPFLDISSERWESILKVNLWAVYRLSQIVVKQMIAQGTGGSIVNMSSKNGLLASSMLAHYNASKAGVILLTQSIAVEMAPHGIRANAVAPGFIDTPLDRMLKEKEKDLPDISLRTPMARLGTIEEVANVFLFLASDESSYVTGSTIVVDGGHLANASEI